MNFAPCVAWVKKGVSKNNPDKVTVTNDDLEKNILKNYKTPREGSGSERSDNETAEEYSFHDYDDDDEAEAEGGRAPLIADIVMADENNVSDPDSDHEDDIIRANDNVIVVGHVEDETGLLDVWVYNEDESYLYVHHNLILEDLPLSFTWMDHEPGGGSGNLLAIGSMSPVISVWDLDIVNCVEPAFKLGSKPNRRKNKTRVGHTKAVLDLDWNKELSHVIASGSADCSIMLWDIDTGTPATTIKDKFNAPIQTLRWHPNQVNQLIAGSMDKTVKIFDCRDDKFLNWDFPGDIERVIWNHFDPNYFMVSTSIGSIHCHDVRKKEPLWTIHAAHTSEVTGLALSCSLPGLLVSSSMDGSVHIWDILNTTEPVLVEQRNLGVGSVYCLEMSPESPFVVAVGGDNKENRFSVWHMQENAKIKERFIGRSFVTRESEDQDMDAAATFEQMSLGDQAAGPSNSKSNKKAK